MRTEARFPAGFGAPLNPRRNPPSAHSSRTLQPHPEGGVASGHRRWDAQQGLLFRGRAKGQPRFTGPVDRAGLWSVDLPFRAAIRGRRFTPTARSSGRFRRLLAVTVHDAPGQTSTSGANVTFEASRGATTIKFRCAKSVQKLRCGPTFAHPLDAIDRGSYIWAQEFWKKELW